MGAKNTFEKYGYITKFLHWTIAVLMISQIVIIYFKHYILGNDSKFNLFIIKDLHKPTGVVILGLGLMLLIWKLLNSKPIYPDSMPKLEKFAADFVQGGLYLFILIMPISGMLMSNYAGYPTSLYRLITIPVILNKDPELAKLFFKIHEISGYIICSLIFIHIAAALKHHFYNKDNILSNMLFECKKNSHK